MRILSLKTGIFGVTVVLIAVIALLQTSFASDARSSKNKLEIVYEGEQFGLGRIPIENTGKMKRVSRSKKQVTTDVTPTALVYAAYTSYTESNGNDTYWPWFDSDHTFLFVAFRVTDNTKVKIRWSIEGPEELENTIEFVDSLEVGELLNPNYWYFAWWQPNSLSEGLYDYSARVKPIDGSGNPDGKAGKDSCQFEIVP